MEQLLKCLKESVSPFHTIEYMKQQLLADGFHELSLMDEWDLEENEKYYVNLYDSNGLAFTTGTDLKQAIHFRIAMAHSDYPTFQIKPEPMIQKDYAGRLNVELYGGMYQKSWVDRPLGVAGEIVISGKNPFHPDKLLYRSERALAIIPSLAIHMERELNKKGALDVSKELVPLVSLNGKQDLLEEIAKELQLERNQILDYDLFLYNMEEPTVVGLDQSMLSAPRLDNISSVSAILQGLQKNDKVPENQVNLMVVFDNEEVGSRSKQGADSNLLSMVLQKVGKAFQGADYEFGDMSTEHFLLSVDVAHGHHPNYEEKSDVTNKAYLGSGFCIKKSVGQKYGTTGVSAAVIKTICDRGEIPYTMAINRTGIPGGSTLGPIVNSYLPFPCADVGMPILAMHSASELGALSDYLALTKFINAYYGRMD